VAEVIRGMAEDGAMVANNHTYFVKENGMKAMSGRDAAFKRQMDPHNLMNPGKMDLDDAGELAAASGGSSGLDLPTTGWQYGQHTQAQAMAEAQASTPPQLQG
jgi:hypothetical protein